MSRTKSRIDELLDAPARDRIEEVVRSAELRSRGEIVPVVVDCSSSYPDAHLRGALLGAGIAVTIAIALLPTHARTWWILGAEACGILVGYVAASVPPLLRLLVGKSALAQAAFERAERAFLEHGLAHTQGRTGVLVFASWLERQAVVLGDEAIHEKMGPGEWQRAIAALTSGISRGALTDGLCDAILIVGDKLAEHFPRCEPDVDELPNQVRTD